jgi:predicted ATP-dependent endonuclease of OLD family
MSKIGFRNFRRFKDFTPIDFRDIGFLVGRNNSGKSTLVKALILIIDYLKSNNVKAFNFSSTNIEDVNIVTYGRAKCQSIPAADFISFQLQIDNLDVGITVSGNDDNTIVDVQNLQFLDSVNGFSFSLNPINGSISIEKRSTDFDVEVNGSQPLVADLEVKKVELKSFLKNIEDKLSQEYISSNNELKNLNDKIKTLKANSRREFIGSGNYSLSTHFSGIILKDIFEETIAEFSAEYEIQYHDIQRGKKPKKIFENLKAFKDDKFKIETILNDLIKKIDQMKIVYLGATLNKQSALFAIRDKTNPLAQSIHEFKQLGIDIDQGSDAHKFVLKWMKVQEFEIGDSFEIKMHAGEAYELLIHSGGVRIPLADKGMGSIQAMLLILRLATIIQKKQNDKRLYTLIIEEPELNLHPALQSKLAELFHDVNKHFQIKFLIETHSEYLIRKTQLIVKIQEYEVSPNLNPFSVIYFDKGFEQWNMNYRADGVFVNDFGSGFFDVSSQQAIRLIKKGV